MAKLGTFVSATVLTAAELNAMGGALVSYTPTWTGVTLGNGTNTGGYKQFGRMTYFRATFVLGTTSAITGAVTVTLPLTAASSAQTARFAVGFLDGGTEYPGVSGGSSTTTVAALTMNVAGTYPSSATISATIPFTWGNGDTIAVSGWYDATT